MLDLLEGPTRGGEGRVRPGLKVKLHHYFTVCRFYIPHDPMPTSSESTARRPIFSMTKRKGFFPCCLKLDELLTLL